MAKGIKIRSKGKTYKSGLRIGYAKVEDKKYSTINPLKASKRGNQ